MANKVKMNGRAAEAKASAGVLLDANFTGSLTCTFLEEWTSKDTGKNRTGKTGDGSMLAYFTANGEKKLLNVSKLYVMALDADIKQLVTAQDEFILDSSVEFTLEINKGSYKAISIATAKTAKAKK